MYQCVCVCVRASLCICVLTNECNRTKVKIAKLFHFPPNETVTFYFLYLSLIHEGFLIQDIHRKSPYIYVCWLNF